MKKIALFLLTLLPAAVGHAQNLPVTDLSVGFHRVEAEVAYTFDTRAKGLMHRKAMAPNHGMLFIFPQMARHCMWMRNTLLPLSVAFLDEQGRILNVEEMQPQTENNHCAAGPARYALEMNAGWFQAKGMMAGTAINGLGKLPPPQ
jgi:uncharacterized protein